jgi:hypothetical protein
MSVRTTHAMMLPRTPLYRWLAVAVLLLCAFFLIPTYTGTAMIYTPSPVTGVDDLTFMKEVLKRNSVGPDVSYASRTIRYIPDAKERLPITVVDHALFPQSFTSIDIRRNNNIPEAGRIELHVKKSVRPDSVDASDLIFAASTTYERFTDAVTSPIKEWSRWLTDGQGHTNGAGLILALFNTTQEEIDHSAEKLAEAGISATVVASDSSLDMAGRYVALVKMLYQHPTRDARKYFGLIDDDTFFPCMNELQRVLAHYDPSKSYYIGTFTERAEWLLDHKAAFGYGGGGIFLTAPVAKKLVEAPCLLKNDKGRYVLESDQGDRLLYNCLEKHTEITLTYLPLLHQEDQFGDPSGFYESGQQPLSLHHYKSWHHFRPDLMHYVADACGEDCVLQRFQFNDNFILSNGFSVAEYPKGIDFDPLQMEYTFDNGREKKGVDMAYTFGALRKSLSQTGRKRSWELLDSLKEGDGKIRQIYLKRRGDGRWQPEGADHPTQDSIVQLLWVP